MDIYVWHSETRILGPDTVLQKEAFNTRNQIVLLDIMTKLLFLLLKKLQLK